MPKQDLVSYMSDVSPHLEHHGGLERPRVLQETSDERIATRARSHVSGRDVKREGRRS